MSKFSCPNPVTRSKWPLYCRKVRWGSKIQQSPPSVPYAEVMAQDDHGLYKWLLNIVSADCIFLVHFELTHLSISSVFHLSLEYPQRLRQLKSSARRLALSEKLNVRI